MLKADTQRLRETWLTRFANAVGPTLEKRAGLTLPAFRITCGFPSRGGEISGRRGKLVLGQCWSTEASADHHAEIFVSPVLADARKIATIIPHELVHAALPGEGHNRTFQAAVRALGYQGPYTEANPTDAFWAWIDPVLARLEVYPHAELKAYAPVGAPKKQVARMFKAHCETCGYTVRVARTWVAEAGPPHCPKHGAMSLDIPDDDASSSEQ